MSDTILTVQVFAGTVEAASPEFKGLRAPATLTLIERATDFECKFVFFVGEPLALTVRAPKTTAPALEGVAQDPRGWDVSFKAELIGRRVTGSYRQPHDWGTFALEAV